MRAVLIIVLFIAVAAAGGAAYLASDYLARQRELAAQSQEQLPTFTGQRVMVAAEEIEAGVALRDSMVRWQPWPPEDILAGYKVIGTTEGGTDATIFSQRTRFESGIAGMITRRTIAPGEPITDSLLFNRADAGFMAGALTPGMVAVSINVNAATSASGFIKPGDRVNIILTHDISDALPRDIMEQVTGGSFEYTYIAETVMESLRVLAVDQTFKDNAGDPRVADTITLEVTPSQAEIITLAKTMGNLTLVLRGLSDREKPVGLAALLGVGATRDIEEPAFARDSSVSPTVARMIEVAQGTAHQMSDIDSLRRRLEEQEAAQRRLQEQLDQERARLGQEEADQSAPSGPAWSVTIHRVQKNAVETETLGPSSDTDMPAPAAVGALPGEDIPPDEILIQE